MVAVAFDEPKAGDVVAWLDGQVLHAPLLFDLEMTNAAVSRCRAVPARAEHVLAALDEVLGMPIVRHAVDPRAVFTLALESGLTAYDAAYLWLSRELKAPLVTLDKQLAAAARRH